MNDIAKTCKDHGDLYGHEVIFINKNNIKCKYCVKDQAKRSREKHKDKRNQQQKEKRMNNPEYMGKIREQNRQYKRKIYAVKRDEILESRRNKNAENPLQLRAVNLKKLYGISLEQYDIMFELQNGLCKICNKPETSIHHKTKQIKKLSVDHIHNTKIVRGLLCTRCNCMIGYARESVQLLERGIKYLKDFENACSEYKPENRSNSS